MNKIITLQIVLCLLSFSSIAMADVWDKWDSHRQETQINEGVEDYIWKEGETTLPEYPHDSDLLEIMGPAAYRNYQYFIDAKTLTVGADGVVRYSLVIRSSSGTDNVMFEGLRCIKRQIATYAYGSTDMQGKKTFIKKNNVEWKPLRSDGVMGYSSILATDYFCDFRGVILSRETIIKNIKYGKSATEYLIDN